jgi:ERCC4-type nuclease
MTIIKDTREQDGCTFLHERYSGTIVESGTLAVGDYSLSGLTDKVAVERKSLPDLVVCLSRERDRFERELQRGAALDAFAVIVEGGWHDLAHGKYRSQLNPHAACQSVLAFMARYRVPFFFAGDRQGAEYACFGFLRQYLENAKKRWSAIVRAHGGGEAA